MPSTGFTLAGTGANNADAGTTAWSNASNITADDGSNASASNVTSLTQYLHATNFGFAVPTNANIIGVQVQIEAHYTVDSGDPFVRTSVIKLIVSGSRAGSEATDKTLAVTTPTVHNFGAATDLWGNTLTPAIVNASDFGVAISVSVNFGQADLLFDYVKINVHYGLPYSRVYVIG